MSAAVGLGAPSADDARRWHYVVVESRDKLYVKTGDDTLTQYHLDFDQSGDNALISADTPENSKGALRFEDRSGGGMRLSGSLNGKPVMLELERMDPRQMLLNSRGFHWISETSFYK